MAPLVLALAACADLHKLPVDTCGNGVLESGEACDPPEGADDSASCIACQRVCQLPADCPAGSACGQDGICRQGTGRFEKVGSYAEPLDWLGIGSIDGDGAPDLYGRGGGDIWWYRGDGELGFTLGQRRLGSWIAGAPPTFGQLDADAQVDALVETTPNAIEVLRATPSGWRAVPQAAVVIGLPFGKATAIAARNPTSAPFDELVTLAWDDSAAEAVVQIHHLDGTDGPPLSVPLPPVTIEEPRPGAADLDGDGDDEIVLGVGLDTTLYVIELDAPPTVIAAIPLPHPIVEAPSVADVDGDGRLDLLVETQTSKVAQEVDVVRQSAPLAFDAAAADPRFGPTLLAVADLDLDGVADYVDGDGVYLARPTGFVQVAEPLEPWTDAVVADFNHDGRPDVAAARASGIDSLLGGPSGLFGIWFEPVAGARSMVAGDFDGDRYDDLAVDASAGALMLYGRPQGGPTDATPLNLRGELTTGHFHGGIFPLDDVAELVSVTPDTFTRTVRIFGGSTARLPFAAFPTDFAPGALLVWDVGGPAALALGADRAAIDEAASVGIAPPMPLAGTCGTLEPCVNGLTAPLPIPFERFPNESWIAGVVCATESNPPLLVSCTLDGNALTPPTSFTVSVGAPDWLDHADVDGDTTDDVIVHSLRPDGTEELTVLFNINGDLGQVATSVIGDEADGFTYGNIDGDGHTELVFGQADGVYAIDLEDRATVGAPEPIAGDAGFAPRLGDLDGDGVLDLVIGSADGFAVYRGVPSQD